MMTIDNVSLVMTYRHPKFSLMPFYLELKKTSDSIKDRNIIWFGDFNLDLLSTEGGKLRSVFQKCGFQLCQTSEATTDGNSMLDLAFTNFNEARAWSYESYFSYHKPICIIWPKSICERTKVTASKTNDQYMILQPVYEKGDNCDINSGKSSTYIFEKGQIPSTQEKQSSADTKVFLKIENFYISNLYSAYKINTVGNIILIM